MKFYVSFGGDKGVSLINVSSKELGLDGAEKIRQKTGVKNLSIDKMYSYITWKKEGILEYIKRESNFCVIEIDISEETAVKSGLFRTSAGTNVTVRGSFDSYVCEKVLVNYDKKPEITDAMLILDLNKKQIIDDWQLAGFPKNWKIE